MAGCLRSLLQELRPSIPDTLIDDRGLERLAERVGHLPGVAAADIVALEVRLGDPVRAADCAVAAGPGRPLTPHYIRRGETAPPDSPAARLGRLLAGLRDPGPRSEPGDPRVCDPVLLEYDVVEVPPEEHPEPGLFLTLRCGPEEPPPPAAAIDTLVWLMGWNDRDLGAAVARVCAALPAGSRVGNVGAMPDRAPAAVKVLAKGIVDERISDFLESAGWPGPTGQVETVIEAMAPVASPFALSLDVAEHGLLPRVGLEMAPPAMAKGAVAWRPLIRRLAEQGWCLEEKRRGLMDFPGIEKVFSDEGVFMLCTGISHVKLTVADDGAEGSAARSVKAKAYIGFRYLPFSAYPPLLAKADPLSESDRSSAGPRDGGGQ